MTKTIYNHGLFDNLKSPFSINEALIDYNSRNLTLSYNYDFFLTPNDNTEISQENTNEIIIDLDINIPYRQKINYIPSFLYTFKNAWIQYICILIPTWISLRYLFVYLLNLGVFESFKYNTELVNKIKTN